MIILNAKQNLYKDTENMHTEKLHKSTNIMMMIIIITFLLHCCPTDALF